MMGDLLLEQLRLSDHDRKNDIHRYESIQVNLISYSHQNYVYEWNTHCSNGSLYALI